MLRSPGYTLLELLVTLAIGAVLLDPGGPRLHQPGAGLAADGHSEPLRARDVRRPARSPEVRGGRGAVPEPPAASSALSRGAGKPGFIVFVNRDRDDPPRVDSGEPILQVEGAMPAGSILANRSAFVFRPWGALRQRHPDVLRPAGRRPRQGGGGELYGQAPRHLRRRS